MYNIYNVPRKHVNCIFYKIHHEVQFKRVTFQFYMTFSIFSDLHLSLQATREVTEGQSLILVCNSDGEPKPTFDSWIHTGEFISQRLLNGDIKDNVNTLTINNVSYNETGRYECSAKNNDSAKNSVPKQQNLFIDIASS